MTAEKRRLYAQAYNQRLQPKGYVALTPDQFRAKLQALGFTQTAFARVVDIDPRTVRRYAAGDLVVTPLVAWALKGLAAEVARQEAA